jgi:hypothetical protein
LLDTDNQLLSLHLEQQFTSINEKYAADIPSDRTDPRQELYWADLNLFMVSSKEKSEDELLRIEK